MVIKEKSKRRYRSRQFWEGHVRKWRDSTLTQAEYCRQNNLNPRSLTHWKGEITRTCEEIRFVPVPFAGPLPMKTGTAIKLAINEKYMVEVPDGFTPSTLKQVLQVLEVV